MDDEAQNTTRPDRVRVEQELAVNIKKATSPEESAPKQKHVQSASCFALPASRLNTGSECITYTWDYVSSMSCWMTLKSQPILADEVQIFKALTIIHKLLQEGHPVVSAPL
jgi:huntingtin-interacting protein 1-related protein